MLPLTLFENFILLIYPFFLDYDKQTPRLQKFWSHELHLSVKIAVSRQTNVKFMFPVIWLSSSKDHFLGKRIPLVRKKLRNFVPVLETLEAHGVHTAGQHNVATTRLHANGAFLFSLCINIRETHPFVFSSPIPFHAQGLLFYFFHII